MVGSRKYTPAEFEALCQALRAKAAELNAADESAGAATSKSAAVAGVSAPAETTDDWNGILCAPWTAQKVQLALYSSAIGCGKLKPAAPKRKAASAPGKTKRAK